MGEGLKRLAERHGRSRKRMPDGTMALEVPVPEGYIAGLGRDHPYPERAHLYKGTFADPGLPMCPYGWNRDGGSSYSIWRGNYGRKGVCKICLRRAEKGLDGVQPRGEPDVDDEDE